MSQGYVSAFNGNRDSYQLPLALYEAGLLDSFVTDFYTAKDYRFHKLVPKQLQNRTQAGLPRSSANLALGAFIGQIVGRLVGIDGTKIYPITDRMLSRRAGQVARNLQSALFCYGGYLPTDLSEVASPRVIFQYHPHASYIREIIRRDMERYPYFANLYQNQSDLIGSLDISQQRDWERADHIVCASSVTKRSLEFVGCDPARISVVPYGLDIKHEVISRPHGNCEFLFVGQGVPRKGLHHLLTAWGQANLHNARLTLICYSIEPKLADLARQQANVRLLGRQSRDDLTKAYQQSDVFVMPSLLEGFGLVYLEALANGCFVIGSNETGLPDLNLSSDVAELIEGGDTSGLISALKRAYEAKSNGTLVPAKIAAVAAQWPWQRFREAIGLLAADLLKAGQTYDK